VVQDAIAPVESLFEVGACGFFVSFLARALLLRPAAADADDADLFMSLRDDGWSKSFPALVSRASPDSDVPWSTIELAVG
jgi:hypothetical protein